MVGKTIKFRQGYNSPVLEGVILDSVLEIASKDLKFKSGTDSQDFTTETFGGHVTKYLVQFTNLEGKTEINTIYPTLVIEVLADSKIEKEIKELSKELAECRLSIIERGTEISDEDYDLYNSRIDEIQTQLKVLNKVK